MKGHCLCGDVEYRLTGETIAMYYCHCSRCRRSSGSAFATNLAFPAAGFRIEAGSESLTIFESAPGAKRYFCRRCGSPIYTQSESRPEFVYVRAGTLDVDPGARPEIHLHVASKAAWDEICDDLPQNPTEEGLTW